MIPDRRTYSLSKDQPILRAARRRKQSDKLDREQLEVDFWRNFNLEKFGSYTKPMRKAS